MIPNIFKTIPGFPDYAVNCNGVVLSYRTNPNGKEMKWGSDGRGYAKVLLLTPEGKPFNMRVHRAILETFVGPRPKGYITRHLDGDQFNNTLANLRWGTLQENAADSIKHGTSSKGQKISCVRLTPNQVREIRDRYASGGYTQTELGKRVGLTRRRINELIRMRTYNGANYL